MSVGTEAAGASGGPLADALDRFGEAVGRALSWLTLACVLVCFGVVVLGSAVCLLVYRHCKKRAAKP